MEFECLHEQHVNKRIVNGEIKAANVRDRSERPPAHSGVSEQDWPSDELARPGQAPAGCRLTSWSFSTPKTLKEIVNSASIFTRLPIFEI